MNQSYVPKYHPLSDGHVSSTSSNVTSSTGSRMKMRHWLIAQVESRAYPGLRWLDERKTLLRISWKHGSNSGWSADDGRLFENWASYSGKLETCRPKSSRKFKANFRCALRSLSDVVEVKEKSRKTGKDAYKVFKFLDEKQKKSTSASDSLNTGSSKKSTSIINNSNNNVQQTKQHPPHSSSLRQLTDPSLSRPPRLSTFAPFSLPSPPHFHSNHNPFRHRYPQRFDDKRSGRNVPDYCSGSASTSSASVAQGTRASPEVKYPRARGFSSFRDVPTPIYPGFQDPAPRQFVSVQEMRLSQCSYFQAPPGFDSFYYNPYHPYGGSYYYHCYYQQQQQQEVNSVASQDINRMKYCDADDYQNSGFTTATAVATAVSNLSGYSMENDWRDISEFLKEEEEQMFIPGNRSSSNSGELHYQMLH